MACTPPHHTSAANTNGVLDHACGALSATFPPHRYERASSHSVVSGQSSGYATILIRRPPPQLVSSRSSRHSLRRSETADFGAELRCRRAPHSSSSCRMIYPMTSSLFTRLQILICNALVGSSGAGNSVANATDCRHARTRTAHGAGRRNSRDFGTGTKTSPPCMCQNKSARLLL